jgi:dsRNA-specific ribonuclease
MERQEILGDAFLKFSVGLYFHYKMTNDVTSSEFSGWSYDEGDLSSGRARVVSNRNLCKVAELLQLGQGAIRSLHMDPQTTWLPPGYSTGLQEEALLRLEARMAREHGWAVGDSVARVAREEMVLLGEAEEEEKLVKKLLERSEAKECVAGVLRLRSQRLLSDKSLADCVEAAIGCHLLWGGPMSALHFMARSGVNLSSDNSAADLFSRQQSEKPVLPFSPQV